MRAFRIVKKKHALTAFSGDGARAYGGRWNYPGIPMVYAAHTRALAVKLSGLVNGDRPCLAKSYHIKVQRITPFAPSPADSAPSKPRRK